MDSNINLFNRDLTKIDMPCISNDEISEQEKLKSPDISNAITGNTVKKLIIKEEMNIDKNNFILDMTDITEISVFQKEAIKSLLSIDGDCTVYLYANKELVEVGKADKFSMERMIPLVRQFIFNDELTVYQNFVDDEHVSIIKDADITRFRLNL